MFLIVVAISLILYFAYLWYESVNCIEVDDDELKVGYRVKAGDNQSMIIKSINGLCANCCSFDDKGRETVYTYFLKDLILDKGE